jgi:hypothetical protein
MTIRAMVALWLIGALWMLVIFAGAAQAHSNRYCPAYDYNRNGYHFDYRYQYTNGSGHYHVYYRTPGLRTVHRWCAV